MTYKWNKSNHCSALKISGFDSHGRMTDHTGSFRRTLLLLDVWFPRRTSNRKNSKLTRCHLSCHLLLLPESQSVRSEFQSRWSDRGQGQGGDRPVNINDTDYQGDFKSHQWFGATVRSHGDTILACAPLYSWRTEKDVPHSDATGTCYLSAQNFTKFVEYAPCRTEISEEGGQGYCQGGFSADFTTDGKVVLGGPGSYFWQDDQYYQVTITRIWKANKQKQYVYVIETFFGDTIYDVPFHRLLCGCRRKKFVTTLTVTWYFFFFFLLLLIYLIGTIESVLSKGSFSVGHLTFITTTPTTNTYLFIIFAPDFNSFTLLINLLTTALTSSMGSYFGYSVATTDINSDGLVDLLVGAPMFMVRGSGGRLEEMGRVYVYLQQAPLRLELSLPHLTGTQVYARFGNTIAPLGDLNQDGFNDVAISAPFGGDDHQGLVYIFNGFSEGLREKPSQEISGQWASTNFPASFGFSLRGSQDLDLNGYPDLIVGAFGVDKAVLYRSRPIVNTTASLTVQPGMINPEEKNCVIADGNASIPVSCVNVSFCLSADGKHLPDVLDFQVEVQLDSRDHKKKGAVKRALFLETQQPRLQKSVRVRHGQRTCDHKMIYLKGEKEFRDKLSPIYVAFNYSLDPTAAADSHGLRPILNYHTTNVIEQKAQILLDCGEDNICVPDLKLAVLGDRKEVYLGDDNALTLTFNARNEGEGGAYEAELYVVLPPEADYSGIARNNESRNQLTCSYDTENQTRYLSCELGNPMKSGTSMWEGLRFTVPRLKDTHKTVQFDLQIRSKNENNSHSEVVTYKLEVVVQAEVILQGVSRPDKVFFPPANWKATKAYSQEQDIGPAVDHIYELVNNGPSRISHTILKLHCPLRVPGHSLLYPVEFFTEGPINCTSDHRMNNRNLKIQRTATESPLLALKGSEHRIEKRDVQKNQLSHLTNLSCSNVECWTLQCSVGLLERGTTAILRVRSRVWADTFMERAYKQYVLECLARYSVEKMPYAIPPKHAISGHKKVVTPVVWTKPDIENSVPLWIIILAVLVGLLLLALLIYILYKLGFFKRSVPYGTAMEKAQLKPQAASEA
ncbi:hypothetical protein WMY93_028065 [Mugilogobius chulae]|uniref:Integrin alpha-2 domain-containing protein n=1 Tax=Mugilogobius chulae TaxID=88201 RepID=A0AAW0N0H0_9GOBI